MVRFINNVVNKTSMNKKKVEKSFFGKNLFMMIFVLALFFVGYAVAGDVIFQEGDLESTGNMTADYFIGDGSLLTGVGGSSYWNRTGTVLSPVNSGDDVHLIDGTTADQLRLGTGGSHYYKLGRESITGFFTFQGTQTGYTGYEFKSDNGETLLEIDDAGDVTAIGDVKILADNKKLFMGNDEDASIYYDGANLVFDTSEVGGGLAWFSDNVSATGFMTRTQVYDKSQGKALDKIKDASDLKKGDEIDHSEFYGYVEYDVTDFSRPEEGVVEEEVCEFDEDGEEVCETVETSKTIYPHRKTEEGVDIVSEIELLRQAIYELKLENEELRALIK
jgi:hypothetical protein